MIFSFTRLKSRPKPVAKTGTDLQGRAYLTFNQARAGRSVELDGGFDCAAKGARKMLQKSPDGLYFRCNCGTHLLDGQVDFDGGRFYVGVYPATAKTGRKEMPA